MHKNVGSVFFAKADRNHALFAAGIDGFIVLSDIDGPIGEYHEYGTLGIVGPESFDDMSPCYVYP